MTKPADIRAAVPAFEDVRYMNTGASGPSPQSVVQAAQNAIEMHEWGVASDPGPYPHAFDRYDDIRSTVADFLGACPEEIALTQSTSDGINRVAGALSWEPGDVIVRTDLEHPAGVLPWERLERRGCDVRVVPTQNGRIDRDAYRDAVSDASFVCLSALTWNYGTILPVEALVADAHDAGAFVLVDAVQIPGQRSFDVTQWDADAVAMASHKWMLGLWGGGILYIDDSVIDDLDPAAIGYRSVVSPGDEESQYELKSGAARFEVGTTNTAPYTALESAIEIIEDIGTDTIQSHINMLTTRASANIPSDRLVSPSNPESGLVTVHVENPQTVVDRLNAEHDIVVRTLPDPADSIRASLHVYNTREDVDALLSGLQSTVDGW
ncbi:aminotransferase class V-fold PLP-dependent enzyme [Haloquadratum walsbyi]|uniref:Probable cysteine desulfurase n=1 Tax=Haloquadratum walsbyi (strain DSM 16854 / JCM 12705 / C23) TaxID=768065 RepID=G0LKF4_HALWC|nr:aminotransferase class V-fold PLP-dependent enzyme [Haloquadratum walsbyi]CCC39912.1 probable cysteine desulfurase [Haloquadratum walsbyi C23]